VIKPNNNNNNNKKIISTALPLIFENILFFLNIPYRGFDNFILSPHTWNGMTAEKVSSIWNLRIPHLGLADY
jgi:hypothetical protein